MVQCTEKLGVEFDDPGDGWVGVTLSLGSRSVIIIASYTPYDSFLSLVNALYNLYLYDCEAKTIWNTELIEYELQFARSEGLVSLQVLEFFDHRRGLKSGKSLLSTRGSYQDVAIPFWRALRKLQGRLTANELNTRWHRPFPSRRLKN